MAQRFAYLVVLPLLLAPVQARAGAGVSCDPTTNAPVLTGTPADAQEQYVIARALAGYCRTHDRKGAEQWYLKAAEAGHKDAQFELGELYMTGLGLAVDYPAAKKWYLKAAEQDHGGAQLRLGFLYAEKHFEGLTADLAEAEKWFLKAAEQDAKDARFRLGNFYLNYKQPPDVAKAREWLVKAAEGGNRSAMFDAGRLLMEAGEKDAGHSWIIKAAEADELQAQIMLVKLYEQGRDVPRDADKAFTWLMRIANQKAAPAFYLNKAGDMLFDGHGDSPRNYPAARKLYERAAKMNDDYALRRLGLIYKEGLGVKKDEVKAKSYLDRADTIR